MNIYPWTLRWIGHKRADKSDLDLVSLLLLCILRGCTMLTFTKPWVFHCGTVTCFNSVAQEELMECSGVRVFASDVIKSFPLSVPSPLEFSTHSTYMQKACIPTQTTCSLRTIDSTTQAKATWLNPPNP
jgi:hypothetical protein